MPDKASTPNTEDGGKQEYTPPATQEELDRIVEGRLAKDRKGRLSEEEVESLKEKAQAFDKAQEEGKSELEKAIARAEKAESKIKAIEDAQKTAKLRADIAKEVGVPAHLLKGESEADIRKHAEDLASFAVEPDPLVVSSAGKLPASGTADPKKEAVKALFGRD